MFDLNFHEAVIGYVALNDTIKQNSNKIIKNIDRKQKIYKLVTKHRKFNTFDNNLAFNYYMKTYLNYFDMKLPDAKNQ